MKRDCHSTSCAQHFRVHEPLDHSKMQSAEHHAALLHRSPSQRHGQPSERDVSNELPLDVWHETSRHLSRFDLYRLSFVSKTHRKAAEQSLNHHLRELLFEEEITAPMMRYIQEQYQNEHRRHALTSAAFRQQTLRISINYSSTDDQVKLLIDFLATLLP